MDKFSMNVINKSIYGILDKLNHHKPIQYELALFHYRENHDIEPFIDFALNITIFCPR